LIEGFEIPDPWECIKCGMCCQRYDKENDVIVSCQHLQEDKSCGIYEDRPLACRLDFMDNNSKINHCNICIASITLRRSMDDVIRAMVVLTNQAEHNG
jgi:Fe-S-cluster containining protein